MREKKKGPNLNACSRSNNWDEVNGISGVMGAGSLRPLNNKQHPSKGWVGFKNKYVTWVTKTL